MMEFRKLRERVTIQSIVDVPDEHGNVVGIPVDGDTVWASVKPLTGRELEEARQISARASVEVRMRFRSDVTPNHQLDYRNRTLNINHIANVYERRRELRILCTEVV